MFRYTQIFMCNNKKLNCTLQNDMAGAGQEKQILAYMGVGGGGGGFFVRVCVYLQLLLSGPTDESAE